MDITTRHELSELAERYAAGCDRRDGELFASAFLPDGSLTVHNPADGPALSTRTGREVLSEVPGLLGRYDATLHTLANRRYEMTGDDTARGEVVCIAHHIKRDAGTDFVMHIRYDDTYGRGDEGWGITSRACRVLWTSTHPIDG